MQLSDRSKNFLALILRSPDKGAGWRVVSPLLWILVDEFENKELLEIDADNFRIRLNDRGGVVADYL